MSHLRLVQEFSDVNYPYDVQTPFEYPLDPDERYRTTAKIQQALFDLSIPKHDVKVLERHELTELLFRDKLDRKNFHAYFAAPVNEPANFLLTLPQNRRYPNEARRLCKWLQQAAYQTQQTQHIDMGTNAECEVLVIADNSRSYFETFKGLPRHRRQKIEDINICALE
jgi:hypothetical protein